MGNPINWTKVREAAKVIRGLTFDEYQAALAIVASVDAETKPAAEKPKPRPKPQPCLLCDRVFGTAHGLKVHTGRRHKTGELFPKEVKHG